jgi:hypothetical protein
MFRYILICLVLALPACAQTTQKPSMPAPNQGSPSQQPANQDSPNQTPAPAGTANQLPPPKQFPADLVPQDAVIITITGLCNHPAGAKPPADCKTTMTRAEFEKIVDALKPHAPQGARRLLATTYTQSLIKEQKAKEMGLDKTPDFANRLEVNRLAVSHEALDDAQSVQEWNNVTDKEIEDYYRQNPNEFVEVDVLRVFVPWFEPDENKGLPEAEREKRDLEWQSKLKVEAEKLRAQAMAGEDFLALQTEAYKFTVVTSEVNQEVITLRHTRRSMLDDALMPMMDLQPGQFSALMEEDNGYYIVKGTRRAMLPFDERTKREIRGKFRDQRVSKDKEEIKKLAANSTTYNDSYFGSATSATSGAVTPPDYDVMPSSRKKQ